MELKNRGLLYLKGESAGSHINELRKKFSSDRFRFYKLFFDWDPNPFEIKENIAYNNELMRKNPHIFSMTERL